MTLSKAAQVFLLFLLFFCLSHSVFAGHHRKMRDSPCPFIIFSPPKTGTHLVAKILELITDKHAVYCLSQIGNSDEEVIAFVDEITRNNGFVVAHNFNQKQLIQLGKKGYKIIFTLRDPRDHLVSVLDWLHEGQWTWLGVSHMTNFEEQIEELITGERFKWRLFEQCINRRLLMLKALNKSYYKIVRFEHLVGVAGNGSQSIQEKALQNLAYLINLKLSTLKIHQIANEVFGNSPTFRIGQIQRWKDYFSPYHTNLYKKHYGDILLKLGYEDDFNW